MATPTKAIKATAVLSVSKTGAAYKGSANSTHNTALTWALVQSTIAANPKTTRAQLFTVLQTQRNHACFVTYALNRGWLTAK